MIIEYPQDVVGTEQVETMLDAVHAEALATGLFDDSHVRVRAIPFTHYRTAGKRDPFIHVQCRIHAGRTDEQKRELSEEILMAIRDQELAVKVITVEVVEMDRPSYAKYVTE